MAALDELAQILFGGTEDREPSTDTRIIYAVAVSASENGEVLVRLDEPVYKEEDEDMDSYSYLSLGGEDDDVNGIQEDDEEEEEELETVYWESADDDAVEEDS